MSKETKITPAAPEEIFSLIKKIFEELMPFDRLLGVKVENLGFDDVCKNIIVFCTNLICNK